MKKNLIICAEISENEKRILEENLNEWKVQYYGCDASDKEEIYLIKEDKDVLKEVPVLGFGDEYRGAAPYTVLSVDGISDHFLDMVLARYYNRPLKILETGRLVVREMTEDDLPELYRLYGYSGMTDYVENLYEYDKELEFTRNYINNMYRFYGYGLWLVFRKEDGQLIGRIGLENREIDGVNEVELGYMTGSPFWRMGYAYECCSAVVEYAFGEDGPSVERLMLCTKSNNIPSVQLAKKLGFKLYAESVDTDGFDIYCKNYCKSNT